MQRILYSPGYGAGFATWAGDRDTGKMLATDTVLVELVRDFIGAPDDLRPGIIDKMVRRSKKLAPGACTLAIEDGQVALAEVPDGQRWRIVEYDGSESVESEGDSIWW